MDHFGYRNGELYCEDVPIRELAAKVGTPLYLYSHNTLTGHYDRFSKALSDLKPLICFSTKSCGNIHLLRLLTERGAGLDIVSGGELFRAQQAGVDPAKVVFAGVGKTDAEIEQGLRAGIGWFNVESPAELENLGTIAGKLGARPQVAVRINPNVADARTHEKTRTGSRETKFGVDIEDAPEFFETFGRHPHIDLCGLHIHLGSPLYSPEPHVRALKEKVLPLIERLRASGHSIRAIDIGGGFSAEYGIDGAVPWETFGAALSEQLTPFVAGGGLVIVEPGRTLAANAGTLIAKVQYVKKGGEKRFVILDAGMSQLIRPTLYEAYHFMWPVQVQPQHVPPARGKRAEQELSGLQTVDVVGPVCESSDYYAKDRNLPPMQRGDLLCVFSTGAYGMVMASQYNATPRPPEVLVDGDKVTIIRRRETYDDLIAPELDPQPLA